MEQQKEQKKIIMNTKQKLLAVLLISLIVFVGGGFVLYNQYQGNDMIGNALKIILPESEVLEMGSNYTPMHTTGEKAYKPSTRKNMSETESPSNLIDINTGVGAGVGTGVVTSRHGIKTSSTSGVNYAGDNKKEIRTTGGGTSGSMGLIAGTNRNTDRGIGESSSGIGSTGGYISGPMSVPFVPGGDNWALVDPEPITNKFEDQIVPVGGAVIPLMLLSLLYGFVIIRRRK